MKTKLKVILVFMAIIMTLTQFIPVLSPLSEVLATSSMATLSFSQTERTLALGKTSRYNPTKKGIKDKLTWTSSNPYVAIVDEDGKVTSVSRGETTITASSQGLSASYNLTVIPGNVKVYDEETNEAINGTIVLTKDEQKSLMLQDEMLSIADSEVEWTSSKPEVVSVSEYGQIQALDNGVVTITAKLKDNEKAKATARVNVATPVDSIELSDMYVETYVNDETDISWTVYPEYAANSRVKFDVENPNIATISSKGTIRGKSEGTTRITVTSVSNPEVSETLTVDVLAERDYRTVKLSAVLGNLDTFTTAKVNKVRVGETSSWNNDFGSDAVFTNNNPDIVSFQSDENSFSATGLRDGLAVITVNYGGMTEEIEITSGNYIKKNSTKSKTSTNFNRGVSVEKVMQDEDPLDETKEKDYVKDYPLEVGILYDLLINISPVTADPEDLMVELSNTADFRFESGKIVATSPNKTTNLTLTSKTNPKLKKVIKLKSSVGNVEQIAFAHEYVGDEKFDINEYREFGFNPIIVMESGRVYNPITNPEIVDNEIYKALKKNIKITTEDEDVVKLSNNSLRPIKGVNGTGILKMVYDKRKNSRSDEYSDEIEAYTNFEVIGKIIETIKKIEFVQKEYYLTPGESTCFNPKFTLSEGTVLDPTQEGVADSDEYKEFLSQIGLMNGDTNSEYIRADGLLNYRYKADGNTNNVVDAVYEGKCKIKMVVHADNNISAQTTIQIRSPYAIKNIEEGLKVSKYINKTMYVNTDSLKVSNSNDGSSDATTIPRSTAVWVAEKYSNNYARIIHNGDENLYVEYKYLAETQEKTIKKVASSNSGSSYSSTKSKSSSKTSSSKTSTAKKTSTKTTNNAKTSTSTKNTNGTNFFGYNSNTKTFGSVFNTTSSGNTNTNKTKITSNQSKTMSGRSRGLF